MNLAALLEDYERSHQSGVCKVTHAVGIPLIAVSPLMLPFNWRRALFLFASGWTLQFIGHAVEGKQPKFFEGAEYLLAGLVWWVRLVTTPLRAVIRR